jgi:hypothetical protein
MLSAEETAEMAEDTRPAVAGRPEPGRSITGSARPAQIAQPADSARPADGPRPAESAELEASWPGYPMADYRSPSGSGPGAGTSQANPVAAAAESVTSFAELATLLSKGSFAPTDSTDSTAEVTAADGTDAALPIAGYDELSLPSLRARLRNLDADQLQVLVDYERTHASRADVVTMFERRIVKLSDAGA